VSFRSMDSRKVESTTPCVRRFDAEQTSKRDCALVFLTHVKSSKRGRRTFVIMGGQSLNLDGRGGC